MTDDILLSDDKAMLQIDRVHHWLADTYWSPGIDRETVERAIAGSHCVGAYRAGEQIGYARAVTDHATFAWIADVYVADEARGHGLGRRLVSFFLDHPDLADIRRILLATLDAHGVYAALGFAPPRRPDLFMERLSPAALERLQSL